MNKVLWVILLCAGFASAALGQSKFCVSDYGAKADGSTDCTAAFQQALDSAYDVGGGNVTVPTGEYAVKGNLTIKDNVFLVGTFQAPPTERYDFARGNIRYAGSQLYAYAGKGKPGSRAFITLEGSNCGVKGVMISYPEKGWEVPPVQYPPCIAGYTGVNQSVIDVMLLNPYEGIRLVGVGRSFIRNVYGYPTKRGLYIDKCYDISRVENCHFWPFGGPIDAAYGGWINKHGTAFEFARTDWQYVSNCFCFGYGTGYRFSKSDAGSSNGNFLGLGADSCAVGIRVDDCQNPGLLITNGEFVGRWGSPDSVPVVIMPGASGKVSLMNCSFWGPINTSIRSYSDSFLSVIGCHFQSFGSMAIDLQSGSGIIENNTFVDGPVHINIARAADSAIITGNASEDRLIVKNAIGSLAQIGLNKPGLVCGLSEKQKNNYYVLVGDVGDAPFVEGFHGMEKVKRWSSPESTLLLPVPKNKRVTVTVELNEVPAAAIDKTSGLYLDGKQVASLAKAGAQKLSFTVKTTDTLLRPVLRVKGWYHESGDHRQLGVGVHKVTVSAGKGRAVEANRLSH